MKYTERQREQRRIASRKWKQRNREKARAQLKNWLEKNKSRRAAWIVKYAERTKEHRKLVAQAWHRKNRDDPVIKARKAAYMKKWAANNRSKKIGYFAKRKAAKLSALVGNSKVISGWISKWRKKILVRCYWCRNRSIGLDCHADHIVPLSKGGAHSIENLCVSCADCNRHKHDKLPMDWNTLLIQPVLF